MATMFIKKEMLALTNQRALLLLSDQLQVMKSIYLSFLGTSCLMSSHSLESQNIIKTSLTVHVRAPFSGSEKIRDNKTKQKWILFVEPDIQIDVIKA